MQIKCKLIRIFLNYLLTKRKEKIQKNNILVPLNICVLEHVENTETKKIGEKKRGRPKLSDSEKEEAKKRKKEKDRERMSMQRSHLLTPEKKQINKEAKLRMSKLRAQLQTPEKKKILAKEKIRISKLRSQLLTPEKKQINEDAKLRMSKLRAQLQTPEKIIKRKRFSEQIKNKRAQLNSFEQIIQKIRHKIYEKKRYEKNAYFILKRKRENYRMRVILDALSKMDKLGKIDNRFLKKLPTFNQEISEYLEKTKKERQKCLTNKTSSFSLRDSILLSNVSKNLKRLYFGGDLEVKKYLDILFLANAEYVRINPEHTDLNSFLKIYETVLNVYGKAYRGLELAINEVKKEIPHFISTFNREIKKLENETDENYLVRKIGGYRFHLFNKNEDPNLFQTVDVLFPKIYNQFMGLEIAKDEINLDVKAEKDSLLERDLNDNGIIDPTFLYGEPEPEKIDKEFKIDIEILPSTENANIIIADDINLEAISQLKLDPIQAKNLEIATRATTLIRLCDNNCEKLSQEMAKILKKLGTNFEKAKNDPLKNLPILCEKFSVAEEIINSLRMHYQNIRSMQRRYADLKRNSKYINEFNRCIELGELENFKHLSSGVKLSKNCRTILEKEFISDFDEIHSQSYAENKWGEIIEKFEKGVFELENIKCDICGLLNYKRNMVKKLIEKIEEISNNISPLILKKDFIEFIDELKKAKIENVNICKPCSRSIMRKVIPSNAIINGLINEPIPRFFEKLNWLETILIKPVRFMQCQILLKPTMGGGKNLLKAAKGNVLHMPVPIRETLEHTLDTLPSTKNLTIEVQSFRINLLKRKDIVNVQNILEALEYLKQSNFYYEDIIIDTRFDLKNINFLFKNEKGETILEGTEKDVKKPLLIPLELTHHGISDVTFIPPTGPTREKLRKKYMLQDMSGEPISYNDQNLDVKCFPELYPTGRFGLNYFRHIKLSRTKFIHNRLRNSNRRYMKPDYLFFLVNLQDLTQINSSIVFQLKKSLPKNFTLEQTLLTDNSELDDCFQSFFPSLRGHKDYFKRIRNQLSNMFLYFGPPTFFITLNPAEKKWGDLHLLYQSIYDVNIDSENILEFISKDPGLFSRYFYHRINQIFKHCFLSENGLFGKISHFFRRFEYQQRGTTHCHLLLWVEKAPRFDSEHPDTALEYIQNNITCRLPDKITEQELYNLVTEFQIHRTPHGPTCKRVSRINGRRNEYCRFGFPRPISSFCQINSVDNSIPKKLGIYPKLYLLKRGENEVNINDYNVPLLLAWKGNIDIQFVSDNSVHIVDYVTSYVSKGEGKTTSGLDDVLNSLFFSTADRSHLMKAAMNFLRKREMSIVEACDRLHGNPIYTFSLQQKFLNNNESDKRIRTLKPMGQLKDLNADDQIFHNNFIDTYYPNRPKKLENFCLFNLFSNFDIISKGKKLDELKNSIKPRNIGLSINADSSENEEENYDDENPKDIFGQYGFHSSDKTSPFYKHQAKQIYEFENPELGAFFSKNKCILPQIFWPNFEEENQEIKEDFYRRVIFLFMPWRIEKNLISPFKTFEEKFNEFFGKNLSENALEDINKLIENVKKTGAERILGRKFKKIQDENIAQVLDIEEEIEEFVNEERIVNKNKHKENIEKLNIMQRTIFDKVIGTIENQINKKFPITNENPLRLNVGGGGGRGKSMLINTIADALTLLGTENKHPILFLSASTGKAATAIKGNTVHSLLSIRPSMGEFPQLKSAQLEEFRLRFSQCRLIIIDEISMISNEMLVKIHLRLQEIGNSNFIFGGFNLIIFGDILQLPPVKSQPIFQNVTAKRLKFLLSSILPNLNLWKTFEYFELTENMRQEKDKEFGEILDRIRIGSPNDNDIFVLLKKMVVITTSKEVFSQQKIPSPAPFDLAVQFFTDLQIKDPKVMALFPTNSEVEKFNEEIFKLNKLDIIEIECEDTNEEIKKLGKKSRPWQKLQYLITNDPTIDEDGNVEFENEHKGKKFFKGIKAEKAGGLLKVLRVAIGCRVMLRRNIDLKRGLSNGAIGTFIDTKKNLLGKIIFLEILFDHMTKSELIDPVSATFNISPNVRVRRRQFPIRVCYGITIHKCQGMTCDNILIDLSRSFSPGMAYVALSRARNLKGIHLINFHIDSIYCSKEAVIEYNRLRSQINLPKLPECNKRPEIAKLFGKQSKTLKIPFETEKYIENKKSKAKKREIKIDPQDKMVKKELRKKLAKIKEQKTIEQKDISNTKKPLITPKIGMHLKLENSFGANHCFANATVQNLYHIPEIKTGALNLTEIAPQPGSYDEFFSILGSILTGRMANESGISSVENLRNHPVFPDHLRVGQQDPMEFLQFILQSPNPINWEDLFRFNFSSTVKCDHCGLSETTQGHENSLQLSVDMDEINFLEILNSNRFEHIEERQCREYNSGQQGCGRRGAIREYNFLLQNTPYLIVCFKLFGFRNGEAYKRTPKILGFNENDQTIYDSRWKAIASIVHFGDSTNSGHYIAYCRSPAEMDWKIFDDQQVPRNTANLRANLESHYVLIFKNLNILQEGMWIRHPQSPEREFDPIIIREPANKIDPIITPGKIVMNEMTFPFPKSMQTLPKIYNTVNFWELLKKQVKLNSWVHNYENLLKYESLIKLEDGNWLNDEILDCYLYFLTRDNPYIDYIPTLITQSYQRNKKIGRRWQIDLTKCQQIFVPLNLDHNHWALAFISIPNKFIYLYDSYNQNKTSESKKNAILMLKEMLERIAEMHNFGPIQWNTNENFDIPQQFNGCDCGPFSLTYAFYLSNSLQFDFEQEHMVFFRRKFCFDLVGLIPFILMKIDIVKEDITKISVDTIVNAANESLLGGGGVDGAIHQAAGPELKKECQKLNGCMTGEAKITKAYNITQIKSIIHTVGPKVRGRLTEDDKNLLKACYANCMALAKTHQMRTIAFPAISTGIFNFPFQKAAEIAVHTIFEWMNAGENFDFIDKICFCLLSARDKKIYENTLDFFK